MVINCLLVGIGGFIGSVFRYLIQLIPLNDSNNFPYKTLIVNILGCFIIGLIMALAKKHMNLSENTMLFIKTGICGGLTTFSTFALETHNMYNNGHIALAIIYIIISVVLGILAVFAGSLIYK